MFMTDRRQILNNQEKTPLAEILPHIERLLAKLSRAFGKRPASKKDKNYKHSQAKWDKRVKAKISALNALLQNWGGKMMNEDTSKVVGAEWLLVQAFEPAVHEEYMARAKVLDDKHHADNPGYHYQPAKPGEGLRKNKSNKKKPARAVTRAPTHTHSGGRGGGGSDTVGRDAAYPSPKPPRRSPGCNRGTKRGKENHAPPPLSRIPKPPRTDLDAEIFFALLSPHKHPRYVDEVDEALERMDAFEPEPGVHPLCTATDVPSGGTSDTASSFYGHAQSHDSSSASTRSSSTSSSDSVLSVLSVYGGEQSGLAAGAGAGAGAGGWHADERSARHCAGVHRPDTPAAVDCIDRDYDMGLWGHAVDRSYDTSTAEPAHLRAAAPTCSADAHHPGATCRSPLRLPPSVATPRRLPLAPSSPHLSYMESTPHHHHRHHHLHMNINWTPSKASTTKAVGQILADLEYCERHPYS